MLQCCLNGNRARTDHALLPVTADQCARAAAAAVAAGADSIHVHIKDPDGARDTFDADLTADVLRGIRRSVPGVPVGVTTGAWAMPEVNERLGAIDRWHELPDFASVNWHEEGAEAVAIRLLERGIDVEAGLWQLDAVRAWSRSMVADRCRRVLLELPDLADRHEVVGLADQMLGVIRDRTSAPIGLPESSPAALLPSVLLPSVLLHGEDRSTWPALVHAAHRSIDTRIGLEDTLELPDGAPAADNEELVRCAVELLSSGGST